MRRAGPERTTAAAAREQALLAAPDVRQVSLYAKQFPPPPPGALEEPRLRGRLGAAPALTGRPFVARTTYQAEMQPRQPLLQPHCEAGRCSEDPATEAGAPRCRPPQAVVGL